MAFTYRGGVTSAGNPYIKESSNGNGAVYTFGDAVLGYNGMDVKFLGTSAANYMQWDESANQLILVSEPSTWNGTTLAIEATNVCTTAGVRNGAMNIDCYRDVAWATNDGNPDTCLKMMAQNRSVSGTYSGVRGLDINARNRTGSCGTVMGGMITAENYNGAGNVVTVTGLEVHSKNNSVATGNVIALRVMDESGSSTGTHYGIEITTGDGAYMRAAGIQIDCNAAVGAGWTNAISFNGAITNVFDFENSDGTNGATLKSGQYSPSGDGVKIKIDVAGVAYYILASATVS